MFYAIKSINDKEVNKLFQTWEECRKWVIGNKAVYRGFPTKEEAEEFLQKAPVKKETFGRGTIPKNLDAGKLYVRYCNRIYEAEQYSVRIYETKQKEKITCVGTNLPTNEKLRYILYGSFIQNEKYGYQFQVTHYEEYIEDTKEAIIDYLSSGVIKGIGRKRAEDIYEKFGSKTIDILENTPYKLLNVKGIRRKTLEKIKESYEENKGARELTTYLLGFGISAEYALKLYAQLEGNALTKIKENPYLICNMRGLTFEDADRIAEKENIAKDNPIRFLYAAYSVLMDNEIETGSTGMEINTFGTKLYNKLDTPLITPKKVNDKTIELIKQGKLKYYIINEKKCIFSRMAYDKELAISNSISSLSRSNKEWISKKQKEDIEKAIKQAMMALNIRLDVVQHTAVYMALRNNLFMIRGGPGTGKTTVIKVIDFAYNMLYPENERIYMAPTGRAARRITETTSQPAYTIHSKMRIFDEGNISPDEEVVFTDSLLIIDEFSMVDVNVANIFFSAISHNCTVVLTGDMYQLPSVGPGSVMRDICESGAIPTIELSRIYRQNENQKICINAKKMKDGDTQIEEGDDFKLVEVSDWENIRNYMAEQYVKYVRQYGIMNTMCLCPYVKEVDDMNVILQDLVNPYDPAKMEVKVRGRTFRDSDVVMQVNVNTEEASNGDIGRIIAIELDEYEKENYKIIVLMNGEEIEYTKNNIKDLSLAYAMTVHKSQGSQADAVVTDFAETHTAMMFMNIPRVAISRAKKEVTVIGQRSALERAIRNGSGRRRITILGYLLKVANAEFVSCQG